MLKPNVNNRFSIIGSSGSGKSNWAYLIMEYLRRRKQPIVIIDHKGEYLDMENIAIINPNDYTGADLAVRLRNSNASAIIDMRKIKNPAAWVDNFLETCLRLPRKVPVLVVIEEAHNYAAQDKTVVSKRNVCRLAAEGRALGYGLCLISQRCSKLHKDAIAESEYIYFLRHNWRKDLDYISDLIGPDRAAQVSELATGQILLMDYVKNQFHNVEKVPLAKRKKRGGTPKAQAVKADFDALTAQYPPPYSQVPQAPPPPMPEPEADNYGVYAAVGIAVLVALVVVSIFIYKYVQKSESGTVQNV